LSARAIDARAWFERKVRIDEGPGLDLLVAFSIRSRQSRAHGFRGEAPAGDAAGDFAAQKFVERRASSPSRGFAGRVPCDSAEHRTEVRPVPAG
jgi:hypothetical protein